MNNVFKIISSDIRALSRSAMAMILVFAMLILPALYAWLNLYACWDPYENVSGISVAIYSEDEDYTLDDGTVVNMSEDMMTELYEESKIGWTVVDSREEAIDGVYDGTYYASVVIEKDFTANLFDLNSLNNENSTIAFYQNQKKNPIATRMTDSASTVLKRCLSQAYIKALMTEVFGHFNGWDSYAESLDGDIDDSQAALSALKQNMEDYDNTLTAFIDANRLLVNTLDETDIMVDDAISGIYSSADTINRQNEIIKSVQADLAQDVKDATDSLETLQTHLNDLDRIVTQISEVDTIDQMTDSIMETQTLLKAIKTSLENVQQVLDVVNRLDKDLDDIGIATCDTMDYLLNQTDYLLNYIEGDFSTKFATACISTAFTKHYTSEPYTSAYTSIRAYTSNPNAIAMGTILVAKGKYTDLTYLAKVSTANEKQLAALAQETLAVISSNGLLNSDDMTAIYTANNGEIYNGLNKIQTRAGKLQEQYYTIENNLPEVLKYTGRVMDDLLEEDSYSYAERSMNAISKAITMDLEDTIKQLEKLRHFDPTDPSNSTEDLETAHQKINQTRLKIEAMRLAFEGIEANSDIIDTADAVNVTEQLLTRMTEMQKLLDEADDLLKTTGDATVPITQTRELAADTIYYINTSMWPVLDKTLTQMEDAMDDISALLIHATDSMADGKEVLNGISLTMMGANNSLDAVQEVLRLLSSRIGPMLDDIEEFQDAEIIADLRTLLGLDPDAVGDYISSPVDTETESVYAVNNYGSGMAPFYTSLAIWIGNIILAAVLKTQPSRKGLRKPKTWQLFFGRYFLFFIMNEIQALIIMLGNLFILKIQCSSPPLYIFTGMLAALAFSMLIYALVLSFGVIGKAASVLLFILQIAGSGGTYPIELLPDQFRALHVFLPFDYSIGAMRSSIAGIYNNDVYIDLAVLALIVLLSAYIGLQSKVFRGFTDYMEEQMEESNLMV